MAMHMIGEPSLVLLLAHLSEFAISIGSASHDHLRAVSFREPAAILLYMPIGSPTRLAF